MNSRQDIGDDRDGGYAHNCSLRDYFAGQALVGYLQAAAQHGWAEPNEYQAQQAAKNAYAVADAMLRERSK